MRMHDSQNTRLASGGLRKWAGRCVRAVFAVVALAGCDGGGLQHLSSYANLVARIEACDTAGFEQVLGQLRVSDSFGRASAQIDADALSAFYSFLKHDYMSAASFADDAVARVAARDDSSSRESLRLMAEMRWVKAESERRGGNPEGALSAAERGRDAAKRAGASAELVGLMLVKSELRRDAHDYQGCLAELRRAEIIIDTAQSWSFSPSKRIGALTDAACIAIDLCHIGVATRLLTKASECFDKASDKAKIGYLCQLVRLHVLMGEVGKAATALSRAEMLVGKAGIRMSEREINAYQSLVRSRMGDCEWAKVHLGRCAPARPKDEAAVVALMSYAEVLCYEGRAAQARAVMEDSLKLDDASAPFLWVLYNDTWLAMAQKEGDLAKALAIQTQERRRLVSTYSDLFAYDDYRRNVELTSALDNRRADELRAVAEASRLRLAVAVLLAAAMAVALIVLFRKGRPFVGGGRAGSLSEQERSGYEETIRELRKQADMLEVTNGRITESIAYAEHIQHAISPSPDGLNALPISGSFVFYSPLDVVSGDFFWYTRRGNTLIVCCADCTGHGVPGALLSMMSATILNNICTNLGEADIDPGAILEKLDGSLIENLAHNREQNAKDGLDAALVALDLAAHTVRVASARRPVVLVKDGVLSTIKGTRRSIGDLEPIVRRRQFETTELQLRKGDKIYMYTDGYSDQFGGQSGEKLKNSMVERFLSKICDDDMDQQSLSIQEMFVQWKGDFPQTDDVTFVGLSV